MSQTTLDDFDPKNKPVSKDDSSNEKAYIPYDIFPCLDEFDIDYLLTTLPFGFDPQKLFISPDYIRFSKEKTVEHVFYTKDWYRRTQKQVIQDTLSPKIDVLFLYRGALSDEQRKTFCTTRRFGDPEETYIINCRFYASGVKFMETRSERSKSGNKFFYYTKKQVDYIKNAHQNNNTKEL